MNVVGIDGAHETFIIRILNQQNATWQGTITRIERKEEQYFRSLLELIKLIDSALTEGEEPLPAQDEKPSPARGADQNQDGGRSFTA
ncbi:MAG: hypothetical protein LBK57_07680 [Clostridiales Family XIII bacterium]|jgi:hypothetical protein|nr:hypothetical protein [Clostridiales Family XIII bacterium]